MNDTNITRTPAYLVKTGMTILRADDSAHVVTAIEWVGDFDLCFTLEGGARLRFEDEASVRVVSL